MADEKENIVDSWPRIIYEKNIKDTMSEYVHGQPEVLDLLAFIGHMYTLQIFGQKCGIRKQSLPRVNALITGPTGFGKTFAIRKFADAIHMPYKKIDCSTVSAEGWKGATLSHFIEEYLKFTPKGFGVLHLDEVDKIGTSGSDNQESKHELQLSLLELLDGDYHHMSDHINSLKNMKLDNVNNSLILLSGSFQKHRNAELQRKYIGFKYGIDNDTRTWKDKLDDLGFMQEFAARIVCSIELEKYSAEQIHTIVTKTKESAYNRYLNLFGRDQTLEPEEIDEIVKKVEDNKNGLRELDSLLFEKYYTKRRNK